MHPSASQSELQAAPVWEREGEEQRALISQVRRLCSGATGVLPAANLKFHPKLGFLLVVV